MSDDAQITRIEKVGDGITHAVQVEGVVSGQHVVGHLDVQAFEQLEKRGRKDVQETLRRQLEALAQHERDLRR
jgi:hypothetical protein